jgi:RimJ/RimL family protein N-acetyltransferase
VQRLRKTGAVLSDHYRSMTLREFVGFLRGSLFKDERIWVYCKSLQERIVGEPRDLVTSIVKGEPADVQSAREALTHVPWELRCDVYDGVSDFFVYRENGTVGHISWLYYKDDPNRLLRLADDECEIKFCLTFPGFRGQGLYPAALQAAQLYLKGQGYRRCFVCAKENNAPSIRGIEKAGFSRVGAVRVRKAFGLQISRTPRTQDLNGTAGR